MSQPTEQPAPAPRQPVDTAHAGTPRYGRFGQPADATDPAAHHPHRVYVGGYVDPTGEHGGCPTPPMAPSQQRGHVAQNQATEAVRATKGQPDDVTHEAFCEDDPRNAGGEAFDPRQQDWKGL